MKPIIQLKNYTVDLLINDTWVSVIRGVNLDLKQGEILGIIGESGSGKSVLLKTMLALMPNHIYRIQSGTFDFEGEEMLMLDNLSKSSRLRHGLLGKEIAYVFQNPKTSLSPQKTMEYHFKEQHKVLEKTYDKASVIQLLKDVGIDNGTLVLKQYPYQLSGGQGQRVALALALVGNPKVIIADEPTSAIDASLKQVMIDRLKYINQKYGTAMVIVTHDFEVISSIADSVYVMYGGLIMDHGSKDQIMKASIHPYTKGLIACVDSLIGNDEELFELKGYPLSPGEFKDECPFINRCNRWSRSCKEGIPKMETFYGESFRCCHPYVDPNLEEV